MFCIYCSQYMIILFMLFMIQLSIAASCLAVTSEQQQKFAEEGWNRVPNSIRKEVQDTFYCCGFNTTTTDPSLSCDVVRVRANSFTNDREPNECNCFFPHSGPLLPAN